MTIEVGLSNVGPRVIDVECSLPRGWDNQAWYLPLGYFPKDNVAPNLEVTGCDGEFIPIPTKLQNHAITQLALKELFASERLEGPSTQIMRELIDEVIEKKPFEASISRWIFETKAAPQTELVELLRLLEENFVLWVPVEGEPMSEHQFRIERRELRPPDRIFVPRLFYAETEIETAAGRVEIGGEMIEGHRSEVRFGAVVERLPKALALRPIEAVAVDVEAGRATSAHLRVQAPPGFVVRNIRAGAMPAPQGEDPQILEMDPDEDDVVIQGWDEKLGHVHLSKPSNPQLYCLVTLGPRSGLITLWMMTATLTAVILWVLHHHSKYGIGGPHHLHAHLILSGLSGSSHHGTEQLAINANNRQIAAAVLLVGPALASAWALRAEGGELLRSFLAGTRILLLVSAAISIAAALALAGVHPTGVDSYKAMEIYAGLAYLVAAPMAAAWLLSGRPVWDLFREVLYTPTRNVIAVGVAGSIVFGIGAAGVLPSRLAGIFLLIAGLALALIGANSVAVPLRAERKEARYRIVAGVGAIPVTVAAGAFLGFYANLLPLGIARIACIVAGVELVYCAVRLRSELVSE